jgi:hypothetical protein
LFSLQENKIVILSLHVAFCWVCTTIFFFARQRQSNKFHLFTKRQSLISITARWWGWQSHPHATFKKPNTQENNHLCTFTLHWWSDPATSQHTAIRLYNYMCVRACVCVKTCEIKQGINSNSGRNIAIATVTRYGLYGSVFELREAEIFCARSGRPHSPPGLLHNAHRVSFPGVEPSGRGINHPPPSRTGIKEKVLVSLAGIAASNPAGGKDVCLSWVLCVVR